VIYRRSDLVFVESPAQKRRNAAALPKASKISTLVQIVACVLECGASEPLFPAPFEEQKGFPVVWVAFILSA